ncbi:L-cystine transport system permease protein tcyB [Aggregatibacter actinomycetemcomitans]|uniref:amino acid ABC transporter permease n=1 Tax=Aggregatibacter actinomycetemcomitans TaxID=714 RepID=UPI0001B9F6A4|nr:amino acid ABC transporter permease [Aggregatibacter actinomycetemcomitans]ACX81701.1 cysteine ABC transporter permease [Aggregatibacter actinomycetemcomitans D11S-1]KOE60177.1 cysteine ABC transporter permease [Aggregatibacter actinomycetemcomitans serotype c str. SCC2302]KOE60852.1 cysteine ABC transporter permease [Aggregatibacter actinomycetemcomitans serotype c str. AAS4A]KOE63210.1 cysteine ABC transporter permease [Aggregatibacter actinomycetemcomitans serotype c str. D17P-2]KYK75697
MTLLNNFLASLPFMNAERANEAISAFWPMLEAAIDKTIPLAIISFFAGLVIALGVAVIRTMPKSSIGLLVLQLLCRIYVSIIRGTPMLVQIFIIFYGLPEVGIKLDPFPTAIIAFSINIGAYASETIRAAILSIPKGQWEASYSIGMNYFQTFTRTIMPQALRVSVPPLSNTFISNVKDTSLASLVLVTEMFRVAQNITAENYEFIMIYSEAALIYWCICLVLSFAQERLEKRLSRHLQA